MGEYRMSDIAGSDSWLRASENEPDQLKHVRSSFDSIYEGPNELYHEFTLQQAAARLGLTVDDYKKLYDLRDSEPLPPYPKASWKLAMGAWRGWWRSLSKRKRRALILGYVRKWGYKAIQGGTLLAFLAAAVHYLVTIPERAKATRDQVRQSHYLAWQTINLAASQPASGGRIEALEALVRDHVSLLRIQAEGAVLTGIDLHRANMAQSNFKGALLGGANLQETVMGGSDLEGAYFGIAKLQYALLPGSNLAGANFMSADMRHAYLRGAELRGAGFTNTNLTSASLSETKNLDSKALDTAHLCQTVLPDKLKSLSDRDCDREWKAIPTR